MFFNDGLEKELEWHLCKVHSQCKQAELKELWEAENVKDPTFKQGIGIREDFDLWEWHLRMLILSGMKNKNRPEWSIKESEGQGKRYQVMTASARAGTLQLENSG